MKTMSGYICARNVIRFDYCADLAVTSLLPVCDEVVVCDSDSDDGSSEMFMGWAKANSKIRVINYPFQNPFHDPMWLIKWMNWARERLNGEMQIYLDADEVIADTEECHSTIRRLIDGGQSGWFKRLNFWGDAHHTVPINYVCGTMVARMGPSHLFMPSDDPRTPEPPIRQTATWEPSMFIFHYGFLRKDSAFYDKSRVVQHAFLGTCDGRLNECEANGKNWAKETAVWGECDPYAGEHPLVAIEWLKERGRL